jgi:tetratricopeptide (TPR) repeat protein
MFMHQAGKTEACFLEASSALERMRSRGEASEVTVQLQTGLGVVRSLQGQYEESALHYERAIQMANMLGNDSLAGRIAANLALTYGRLGRFEDQLRCAEATPHIEGECAPWRDIQLTYSIASVHGMRGRIAKACDAIAALEVRLGPNVSSSFKQRWLLWKADALMVSGLRSEAVRIANDAICGHEFKLETSAFAGPFARWTAIIYAGTAAEPQARAVLARLEQNLEEYDAVDQLEILCASAHLDRANAHRYRGVIEEKLKQFPPCTGIQLRALGLAIE